MRIGIAHDRGMDQDALKLLATEVQARPDDTNLQEALAQAQENAGRLPDAVKTLERLASTGKASPGVYNQIAWLRLCRGDVGDQTLAAAERGVELTRRRNAAVLHTLASVLAERDRAEQAREVLVEALEQREDLEVMDMDAYVLGRIAETFGLADSARGLYAGMRKPAERELLLSSWTLAQRRAARLPAGTASAKTAPGVAPAKVAPAPAGPTPTVTPASQKL
jgi:tetratricopeptide (TPR) repeat protein